MAVFPVGLRAAGFVVFFVAVVMNGNVTTMCQLYVAGELRWHDAIADEPFPMFQSARAMWNVIREDGPNTDWGVLLEYDDESGRRVEWSSNGIWIDNQAEFIGTFAEKYCELIQMDDECDVTDDG